MFQTNEKVVYGAHGVCVIEGTTEKNIGGKNEVYYILKTIFGNKTTIFVPAANEKLTAKMRRVLTRNEIEEIINEIPSASTIWIDDAVSREQMYKEIILSGDRKKIIQLIKTLYEHAQAQRASGRKLHMADERLFREAEKVLYDEFALILGIEPTDVLDYIKSSIDK